MASLSSFGIAIVGTNFAIQGMQLDDFDFGAELQVQFRMSQLIQATAGEYILTILPNRFQVLSTASQADSSRIEVLKRVSLSFVKDYTTRRGLHAVGHNFTGDLQPEIGTATEFLEHIAFPAEFAAAVGGGSVADPALSLTVTTKIGDEATRTLRLEPLARDKTRLFYDLNFNWGNAENPLKLPVSDVLDQFSESVEICDELTGRLATVGAERGAS